MRVVTYYLVKVPLVLRVSGKNRGRENNRSPEVPRRRVCWPEPLRPFRRDSAEPWEQVSFGCSLAPTEVGQPGRYADGVWQPPGVEMHWPNHTWLWKAVCRTPTWDRRLRQVPAGIRAAKRWRELAARRGQGVVPPERTLRRAQLHRPGAFQVTSESFFFPRQHRNDA